MFRRLLVVAFTVGLIIASTVGLISVSGTAQAILIPVGNTTVDTETGLAWLDLTETEGLSPNAALAAHPDFRFASNTEVITLFLNAGMTAADDVSRTEDFADAASLVTLLGATFDSVTIASAQGFAEDSVLSGFFRDPYVQAIDISLTGRATSGNLIGDGDVESGDVGVFLVKTAVIREPATVGLLGLTLTALAIVLRRLRES